MLVDRLADEVFGGEVHELDLRMANQIAQQFPAGIARGSDDGNS